MREIKGKYNTAISFIDEIPDNTLEQMKTLLDQEFTKDSSIRFMPDCHYGAGCVIGTTMTITNKVVPNLVGVDIGCGVRVSELGKIAIDFARLDNYIIENIPSGRNVNKKIIDNSIDLKKLKCYSSLKNKSNYLERSIGTLGGGNHFIEIDKDDDDNYYLVIHTGSRNLGKQVAEYYQKQAIKYHEDKEFDKDYRLNKKNVKMKLSIPRDLCYLEGDLFKAYLHDMDICQKYAVKNREIIEKKICEYLEVDTRKLKTFESIHNYINMDDMILRKGAISAYIGEELIIPINMRDGCIIARGKSSKNFNYSAPHGAGRILSRRSAMRELNLLDYIKSMKGIYTSSVRADTIDEAPFAYKPIEVIIDSTKETMDIIKIIKPVYNYKCAE